MHRQPEEEHTSRACRRVAYHSVVEHCRKLFLPHPKGFAAGLISQNPMARAWRGVEIVAADFGLRGLVASDSKVGKAWGTP